MELKTITIDREAYEILSQRKRDGESFSQVIKKRFGKRVTGADLRAAITGAQVSEETLDAMDAQVRGRRADRARTIEP